MRYHLNINGQSDALYDLSDIGRLFKMRVITHDTPCRMEGSCQWINFSECFKPIAFRCRSCESLLSAPDFARAWIANCPHCNSSIRIPHESCGFALDRPEVPTPIIPPPPAMDPIQASRQRKLEKMSVSQLFDIAYRAPEIAPGLTIAEYAEQAIYEIGRRQPPPYIVTACEAHIRRKIEAETCVRWMMNKYLIAVTACYILGGASVAHILNIKSISSLLVAIAFCYGPPLWMFPGRSLRSYVTRLVFCAAAASLLALGVSTAPVPLNGAVRWGLALALIATSLESLRTLANVCGAFKEQPEFSKKRKKRR